MKKMMMTTLIGVSLLAACAVVPVGGGHRGRGGGGGAVIVPLLPPVVVFDVEPYYVQGGFHYHYVNDRWYYARSRSGPWTDLPRDRYPREVRYKNRDRGRGRR
jgi:hypothetical protein